MKKYKVLAEYLDEAIREYEVKNCGMESGFKSKKRESPYENYLSNDAWEKFYDDMARYNIDALKRYSDGSGGEMNSNENGSPPKMASFGSSSRMIYNLVMKDEVKERFLFEEKLSTTIGGIANLDGFMQKGNTYIFVEAKCREPYSAKSNDVKTAYCDLYAKITELTKLKCECKPFIRKVKDKKPGEFKTVKMLDVTFKVDDKIINYFDMKQMICHLLAVGTAVLTNYYEEMNNTNDEDIKLHFIYLTYDPRNLNFEDAVKEKIENIYNDIFSFCNGNENQFFKDLFKVILEFLKSEKGLGDKAKERNISKIVDNFTFHTCSQEDFKKKCESLLQ